MANSLGVNLIAAWLNDEVSGKRFDAHINGFDFEVESGDVGSTAGIKGNACAFGTDIANRLSRADDGSFDFPSTRSFSVAAWFNQVSSQNNPMIGKWDASGAPDIDLSWLLWHRTTNNKLRFSISSDGTSEETIAEPGITTPITQWNLGAGGWDALNNEIWVQLNLSPRVTVAHLGGAFAANVSLTTGWFEGNGAKVMGNHDQDESYVWDRFITSDEFLIKYASGAGLFFSDFEGGAMAAAAPPSTTGMITAPGWTRAIGKAIIPGGAAGDHVVPGPINFDDGLLAVKHVSADLVTNADITAEFTITGANTINNAAGTVTTGDFLLVSWAEG